ncbi:MAG TPA: hypothetical protein VME18_05320 [Acidobacteriaceae bacterium]|nr:hypothetical protein [Acidobacteriaceae bacterium]
MRRRPFSVTLLACLYLAVGVAGFAAHFRGLLAHQPDACGIEITEFLAAVVGLFLLLGHNWARWLALAWIAFHVAISIHDPRRLAIHSAFLILFAWILFRRAARLWFRPASGSAAA